MFSESEKEESDFETAQHCGPKFNFSVLGLKVKGGRTKFVLVDLDEMQIMLPNLELGTDAEEGRDIKPACTARFAPKGVSTQYRNN